MFAGCFVITFSNPRPAAGGLEQPTFCAPVALLLDEAEAAPLLLLQLKQQLALRVQAGQSLRGNALS